VPLIITIFPARDSGNFRDLLALRPVLPPSSAAALRAPFLSAARRAAPLPFLTLRPPENRAARPGGRLPVPRGGPWARTGRRWASS